jgi:hypothetical protein
MSLESVFLLLGFALLGAILVSAVCASIYPEAQRSAREWVNTAISIVAVVVLAWTASSIVEQVTEMRKVYPEIQRQGQAAVDQANSFISTERARMFVLPTGVQRSGDKDPSPKFLFQFANMGRTAALVSGILAECEVSPSGISATPSFGEKKFDPATLLIVGGSALPNPAGHECALLQPLTEDDFAGLAAKSKIILFKGYVLYQDVLGQTWRKGFGMYGYGDGKFFPLENADAYNAEEKVKLTGTVPTTAPQ